jgi:hypothetical protein
MDVLKLAPADASPDAKSGSALSTSPFSAPTTPATRAIRQTTTALGLNMAGPSMPSAKPSRRASQGCWRRLVRQRRRLSTPMGVRTPAPAWGKTGRGTS